MWTNINRFADDIGLFYYCHGFENQMASEQRLSQNCYLASYFHAF